MRLVIALVRPAKVAPDIDESSRGRISRPLLVLLMIFATTVFAVPVFVATAVSFTVVTLDQMMQPSISPLDMKDPASWMLATQWLPGAPTEHEFHTGGLSRDVSVSSHASGTWRTLRRHGSVQSVTSWDPIEDQPRRLAVGNEYIKVMASAYASLVSSQTERGSHLYLGLGGGTLPMLLLHPQSLAIELDPDVVELATDHLGVDADMIDIIIDDALNHAAVAQGPHAAIFVDVFGADNNVPRAFVEEDFVRQLHGAVEDGGLVLANFHRGSSAENSRLENGKRLFAEVFGSCVAIPSRFQGNVILAAVKNHGEPLQPDVRKAERFARQEKWLFDPESRLRNVKVIRRPGETWLGSMGIVKNQKNRVLVQASS